MNTLGERIRELRTKKGLEQKELADILKVHKGTISNWENDKRNPDNEMLSKIADFFSVSVDYLLGRENPLSILRDYYNSNETKGDSVNLKESLFFSDAKVLNKAVEILEVIKKAGINLENIDYNKLEQLLKLANVEKEK